MNWKDELHKYLNDNGLQRISYLNDNIIEPAIRNFVEEIKKFDWLKDSVYEKKIGMIDENKLTYFHLYIPHTSIKLDPYIKINPDFFCKVYILNREIIFEVLYDFKAAKLLGEKADLEIKKVILKKSGWTTEELNNKIQEHNNNDGVFTIELSFILMGIKKEVRYKELFEINEMTDPNEISKRLLLLYKENCKVYKSLYDEKNLY